MSEYVEQDGPWFALYSRHQQIQSDSFESEMEAVEFLHGQEEAGELVVVGVHGPRGEKWDSARIGRHFREIYEREHADEIAAEKAKAAEDKARHEAWLAAQPPWKRDHCSSVKASMEDGHAKVELDGVLLPFRVLEPEVTYDRVSGHTLHLCIPLASNAQFQVDGYTPMSLNKG